MKRCSRKLSSVGGFVLSVWVGLSLFSSASAFAQANKFRVVREDIADGVLNLRLTPDSKSDTVYELEPGDFVPFYAKEGWQQVKWRQSSGSESSLFFYNSQKFLEDADGSQASLELPPGKVTTVFTEPGCSWADSKCKGIGWPNRDANIEIIDTKVVPFSDPITGESGPHLFYKIKYSYRDSKYRKLWQGEGWINSDHVLYDAKKTPAPVVGDRRNVIKQIPDFQVCPPSKNENNIKALNSGLNDLIDKQVSEDVDKLKSHIGACLLEPEGQQLRRGRLKLESPEMEKGEQVFDTEVMPHWVNKNDSPKVMNEQGKVAGKDELIAIDTLARTIYGEMAKCYENDPRYLTAVARVVLNRAESSSQGLPGAYARFMQSDSELQFQELKHPITRAVTKPFQFSVWNKHVTQPARDAKGRVQKDQNGKTIMETVVNPSLKQVLCPPADGNQVYWRGAPAGEMEKEIWNHALKVAAKTVLYPTAFKQSDSKGLDAHYYTSGMALDGAERIYPRMGDFTFPNGRCIKFWKEGGL